MIWYVYKLHRLIICSFLCSALHARYFRLLYITDWENFESILGVNGKTKIRTLWYHQLWYDATHIKWNARKCIVTQVTWLVVTKVQSESFGLVTERHHKMGVLCAISRIFVYWSAPSIRDSLFVGVECGIARFLYAVPVFDVRASSSPLGYLCAKFSFFCGLRCWASPWRKIA